MSVRIKEICGRKGFLKPGDEILYVGPNEVKDQLDILYLTAGEGSGLFVIRRSNGKIVKRRLRFETFENYMLSFEEMSFINCRSKCIFCFVDQMPSGMRETLYQKDDDYRLSFLFGNYVTLNDISDEEIDRIIRYNLSPIYISVHSTENRNREKLFGRPLKTGILEILKSLADKGILIHCQIVLVPGINDGLVLEKTVDDIYGLYPACRSVAIVPVGLTRHRKGLYPLERFTAVKARQLLGWVDMKRKAFRQKSGDDPFLFPSDELYLLAGKKLPETEDYGSFDQLSNGVGMCRLFIEDIERNAVFLMQKGISNIEMTVVTGTLGAKLIKKYIAPVLKNTLPGHRIRFVSVRNRKFGSTVGVSGLLTGEDIIDAVKKSGKAKGCLVLPPNCVNYDGVLLDNMTTEEIGKRLGVNVLIPESNFLEKQVILACGRKEVLL